jgi:hypothetical protein
MAATALELSPEPIAVECYQSKVQELTDVITHHSTRFRRIALSHLSNVADVENAAQDDLLSAFTHVNQFRGQAKISTWLTTIVAMHFQVQRLLGDLQAPAVKTRWGLSIDTCRHFDWLTTSVGTGCQGAFAFRESSVPAARAGAISSSKSAESKTPSQW